LGTQNNERGTGQLTKESRKRKDVVGGGPVYTRGKEATPRLGTFIILGGGRAARGGMTQGDDKNRRQQVVKHFWKKPWGAECPANKLRGGTLEKSVWAFEKKRNQMEGVDL